MGQQARGGDGGEAKYKRGKRLTVVGWLFIEFLDSPRWRLGRRVLDAGDGWGFLRFNARLVVGVGFWWDICGGELGRGGAFFFCVFVFCLCCWGLLQVRVSCLRRCCWLSEGYSTEQVESLDGAREAVRESAPVKLLRSMACVKSVSQYHGLPARLFPFPFPLSFCHFRGCIHEAKSR